ncbi:MAG: hypothetical protein AB8G22_18175 [Saprospiraceae bacterium]
MERKTNRTHLSQVAGLLSLGLLLQIVFTYPLWMYEEWRSLPTIPLTPYLSLAFLSFDFINLILLTVVLLIIMFAPQRKISYIVFIVLMVLMWLQDSARFLHPIYTFSVLLALLYFQQEKYEKQLLQALQMAMIGIYFWAGIYQLHPYFIEWVTTKDWWTNVAVESFQVMAYSPGILAILTAFGLFFARTRLYTLGIAVLYHLLILGLHWSPETAYYPLQWIFHITSICLLFVLFRTDTKAIFHQSGNFIKTFPIVPYAFIIFGTVPFFQFSFDLHPTFALRPLSIQTSDVTFFFHRQDRFCLTPEIEPFVFTNSTGGNNQKILNLSLEKWYTTELGVPFYQNEQQRKVLLKELCSCLDYEHQGGFTVVERDLWQLEEVVIKLRCKE